MIKKLLYLLCQCVKNPFSKYRYANLWCYLKNGYTICEFTDLDLYLLHTISEMAFDLANYEAKVTEIDVISGNVPEHYQKILELADMAKKLEIDLKEEVYSEKERIKYRKQFFKQLEAIFFKLWI